MLPPSLLFPGARFTNTVTFLLTHSVYTRSSWRRMSHYYWHMWCVALGNHGSGWNRSILILVQNCQVLIITSRISQHPKSLAHTGSEKSLVELGVLKNNLFHFFTFFALLKSFFSPWAMDSVKSWSTDYNELNEPNPRSLAYIGPKKSLVELGVPKNEIFHCFHIFPSIEKFAFSS